MPSRSNITVLLSLIDSEIVSCLVDVPGMSLEALDALVRDIEGDVERLRGETNQLLLAAEKKEAQSGNN